MGITDENKEKLSALVNKYKRELVFIDISSMESYLGFSFDMKIWHPIVAARLLLDRFLPQSVEKALFIDGDTIVLSSLAELWETDFTEEIVLGACARICGDTEKKKNLGMNHGDMFINGGVLFFNLKQWRKENLGEQLLSYIRENADIIGTIDEDGLNGMLSGRILYLPPKYNFCNFYYELYTYNGQKKIVKNDNYYSREVYDDSVKNPTIIHFLGDDRPWRIGCRHKYKDEWMKYFKKTVWCDEPSEEGWERYIAVWHLFNAVMRPFPRLRHFIIAQLTPAYIQWKKKR